MPRVICDPEVLGGVPCVEGTRVSIFQLANTFMMNGCSIDKTIEDYPFLKKEDIIYAVALAMYTGGFYDGFKAAGDCMRFLDKE